MATADQDHCAETSGKLTPVIDRSRCEGKDDCVRVCPYDVFEVRVLTKEERRPLGFFSRLKVAVHGNRQAFATRAELCHGCGLCVEACPEKAIKLRAVDGAAP